MTESLREIVLVLSRFSCPPILYGSFAGEIVLGRSLSAHDIDLLIPAALLKRKSELDQAFREAGFRPLSRVVPTYEKAGIETELAEWEKWSARCGWKAAGTFRPAGFPCLVLNADSLARLYGFLETDPERPEEKRRKDALKRRLFQEFLETEHH